MTLTPLRFRLSIAVRGLLLLLMLGLTFGAQAQPRAAKHHATTRRGPRVLQNSEDDQLIRNHGTGVRLGSELAAARSGHFGSALEVGAFHQHRLGKVGSVQVEALYFRAPATATATAASGLRLPVLLVLNPFDNVSVHAGPQLRWQPTVAVPTEARPQPAAALTTELVFGAEARISRFRLGSRYAMPLNLLSDLPAAGDRFGSAWKAGQLQVYLGANIFNN